jgi:NAD+ synthase (glutamine-hydrolysing)
LYRTVERFPFVPSDESRLQQDCYEAYNIEVAGLVQRIRAIGSQRVVIGVSGGLDSTHALIVAAKAMDVLGLQRTNILAYTMPGFATGAQSKRQAWALMQALEVTPRELDIRPAATQMLKDMGHPFSQGEPVYDITFENVQAGLRTDYLFRLANHYRGIVIGTGDLSELALGWCTYGVGDQMAHYNVNAGVPKTLIQHLIRWVISSGQFSDEASQTLRAIVAAEISPELVPVDEGQKPQSRGRRRPLQSRIATKLRTQAAVGALERCLHFQPFESCGQQPKFKQVAFAAGQALRSPSGRPGPTSRVQSPEIPGRCRTGSPAP